MEVNRFANSPHQMQLIAEQVPHEFTVLTILEVEGPEFMQWMHNEVFLLDDFTSAVQRARKLNRRKKKPFPNAKYIVAEVRFTGRLIEEV